MAVTNNLNLFDIVDTGSTGVYFSGGGGSPSLDSDIVIAGNSAFGRRVTNTTNPGDGVGALPASAVDLTDCHVGVWVWVTQRGVLNGGGVVYSSQTAKNQIQNNYRISSYTALEDYPSEGGWLRLWYSPTTAAFVGPNTAGTIDFTSIAFIGHTAYFSATPGGNSPNVWVDRIDFTKSSEVAVIVTGTESFSSVAATDANGTNEWGVFREVNGIYNQYAPIQFGTAAAATTINESNFTSALVERGDPTQSWITHNLDLGNAGTTIRYADATILNSTGLGIASLTPSFDVVGTSGSFSAENLSLLAFRNVTLTSSCVWDGGTIELLNLEQGGAEIKNCTIRTRNGIATASCNDATFGETSGIHDCTFVRTGTLDHHAFAVTSSATLTNIRFSGYTTGNNAAIVNTSSNDVVITCNGTTDTAEVTVTQQGIGGTITVVGPDRNFELTGLKDGTEVRLINSSTNVEIAGVETIVSGSAVGGVINNGSGTVTISGSANAATENVFNYAYQHSTDIPIYAAILSASTYEVIYLDSSLENRDRSIPIQQQIDRNFNDPA
jgi:hypothetical protein